jgi:hypothetical protein
MTNTPPTVSIVLKNEEEDAQQTSSAKAIPVLHLALNLDDDPDSAASAIKNPEIFEGVNTRTIDLSQFRVAIDSYFSRLQSLFLGDKRAREFYHYFWQNPRDDESELTKQEKIKAIVFYLFPTTREGAKFPTAQQVEDKIYAETRGATSAEVQAILMAFTPVEGPSTVRISNNRIIDIKHVSSRVVKANQKAFDKHEVLVIGKGTLRTLPRGLTLLPNLRAIHFFGGDVLSLPYWIGDLPLTTIKIINTDKSFRVDRSLQNLRDLEVLKIWAPITGPLTPITELRELASLELPGLNSTIELPHDEEKQPYLAHRAFSYDQAQHDL